MKRNSNLKISRPNIPFLHIHVSYIIKLVYPIADKPTNVRPLTTGVLVTKKEERREVLINKDPISTNLFE